MDQWANQHPGELGWLEQQFLEASRALATRELKAARRSIRRLRALAGGLALLLVAAVMAGGLASVAHERAQAQTRLALSRQLAIQAERLVDTAPDAAVLTGLQSLSLAREDLPEPSAGLMTAMGRVTHPSRLLVGHTSYLYGVAFSPDGRQWRPPGWCATAR